MLAHITSIFCVLTALAAGSAIERSSTPCPYHRIYTNPTEPLVKDEYVVRLREHYTIDQHFQFLGQNLSQHAEMFHSMATVRAYSVRIDEKTMHEHVRYDPGVESVTHNMVFNPTLHWEGKRQIAEVGPSPRQKRWNKITTNLPWWTRMAAKWEDDSIKSGGWGQAAILDGSGKGVDIYILDTGVRITHNAFKTPGRGTAQNFRKKYTSDDFTDSVGHGTMVAGIAIANARWATIVNVKVRGTDVNFDTTIRAIRDVMDDHNANKMKGDTNWKGSIMNMSWAASDMPVFRQVIADAIKAGILIVTSTGNQGLDGGSTPCGYPAVVCVGGVTNQYEKAVTSNYGTGVTIFAPSQELRGPSHKGDLQWVVDSGTSYAAPAVAGIASIFTGFETIRDDVKKVLERLEQNWHTGVLVDTPDNPAEPNILLHTGMEHPDRDTKLPYAGPDPNAAGAELESEIDGTNLPPIGAPEDAPTETGPGDTDFAFPVFTFSPEVATPSAV